MLSKFTFYTVKPGFVVSEIVIDPPIKWVWIPHSSLIISSNLPPFQKDFSPLESLYVHLNQNFFPSYQINAETKNDFYIHCCGYFFDLAF